MKLYSSTQIIGKKKVDTQSIIFLLYENQLNAYDYGILIWKTNVQT